MAKKGQGDRSGGGALDHDGWGEQVHHVEQPVVEDLTLVLPPHIGAFF